MIKIKITTVIDIVDMEYNTTYCEMDIDFMPQQLIDYISKLEYIYGFSMTYEIVKDKEI